MSPMREGSDHTGKAALAVLLQAGFYLLGWGLVAALLGVPAAEIHYGSTITLGGIGAGVVALSLGWALLPPRQKWEPPGLLLERAQEPELFRHIQEIAFKVGLNVPREVYLLADANAFIGHRRVWGRKRRILGLGLPLMQVLTVAQLRAVLAHEFGHEHRGDLRLGPWVYGTRRAMASALEKMDDDGVGLHLFFNWYARAYMRLSYEVSRAQEIHADALAGELCGRSDTTSALRETDRAGSVWWSYWHQELVPVLQRGHRPPWMDGFTAYLQAPNIRKRLDEMQSQARSSGEYDSHPTLSERTAALQVWPPGGPSDDRPATALLTSAERSENALLMSMLTSGTAHPIAWEDVGAQIWVPVWREQLSPYRSELSRLDPATLPRLDLGRWAGVLRPTGPNFMSPEAERRRARELLSMWLALVLVDRGFACSCAPGEPVRMTRGDTQVEPFEVLLRLERGELTAAVWADEMAAIDAA